MQDLKHVFSYLKPYRRDLFLAVGLVFVECIFEMVIPMLMSDLVDQGVPSHDMQVIMLQGSKMIICAVLALITGLLYASSAARAANGFAAALREAEYRKLQQFDFANLDHFSTPSLVTRMTTDVTVMLNAVATGLRPLVRSPVMLFMGLGMAFLLNAKLTIVFLITTPILAAILAWIVTKVSPVYDRQQTAVDHLNGRVQEALNAIRAIKAFVRGDYENEQFETVNDELAAASTSAASLILMMGRTSILENTTARIKVRNSPTATHNTMYFSYWVMVFSCISIGPVTTTAPITLPPASRMGTARCSMVFL